MKVLVMGLPDSGKTTFADKLAKWAESEGYTVERFNADEVRCETNDWDFTNEGRVRQAKRLADMADRSQAQVTITDFVAGLPEQRQVFAAEYTVFMDTVTSSKYGDTDNVFVRPQDANIAVTEW